jgi:NitT/TauT family transport system permease protein
MSAAKRFPLPTVRPSERAVIGSISVALGLLAWEVIARSGLVPPILLSPPSAIVAAFGRLVASGELQRQVLVSAYEFAVGFGLAVAVGLPVSILAGWYTRVGWVAQPLVAAVYAAPTVALFPLIIVFLGIGFWDKVLLVFISGFLQLFVAITAGVRASDLRWMRLARSFGASQPRTFWSIVLPGAIPYILLGLRLAVGRSLVNVVVAEMLASEVGLGYMIAFYGNTFKVAEVFVAILCVVVAGVVLNQLMLVVERRFWRWRPGPA